MIAPSAMFIESGSDILKTTPEFVSNSQLKELEYFGDERAKSMGASGLSNDFKKGYELGLATARAVLATTLPNSIL